MKTCRCGKEYQKARSGYMIAEASIVEINGQVRIHAIADNDPIHFYCPSCTRLATSQEIEFFNQLIEGKN